MTDNPGAFKHYYGVSLAHLLADKITAVHSAFPSEPFISAVAVEVEPLELKGRVSLIARALRDHLPADYRDALRILLETLGPELSDDGGMFDQGYWVLPIAQFVETYGVEDLEASSRALYEITKRFSSEFAVRPYLERYPEPMLALLERWSTDPNPHVRRLVSEGSRPRLPWARRLDRFIADPSPTLALLERLKDDPSAYVRKSVANHLNDIAKDHPEFVLDTAERWWADGGEGRRWIVRHALRTLVKSGHPRALRLLGYGGAAVSAELQVSPEFAHLGETLILNARIVSSAGERQELMVDYCIHYLRANGSTGEKVHKWTAKTLAPGETLTLLKKHPLRRITTRTFYSGLHRIELQINGVRMAEATFMLEGQ